MNITVAVKDIATYESELMTQTKADELVELRSRLKNYFEKYTEHSIQIQKELDDADASQEDYDTEAETVRRTEEEVGAGKIILKTKIAEWVATKEKEKQEDWDRKEKLRLDDLARREKEKEEESKKTLLLIIQQQQLHADAQRAKEIQDQDTKRVQEFQQHLTQFSSPTNTVNPVAATSGSGASSTRLPRDKSVTLKVTLWNGHLAGRLSTRPSILQIYQQYRSLTI